MGKHCLLWQPPSVIQLGCSQRLLDTFGVCGCTFPVCAAYCNFRVSWTAVTLWSLSSLSLSLSPSLSLSLFPALLFSFIFLSTSLSTSPSLSPYLSPSLPLSLSWQMRKQRTRKQCWTYWSSNRKRPKWTKYLRTPIVVSPDSYNNRSEFWGWWYKACIGIGD